MRSIRYILSNKEYLKGLEEKKGYSSLTEDEREKIIAVESHWYLKHKKSFKILLIIEIAMIIFAILDIVFATDPENLGSTWFALGGMVVLAYFTGIFVFQRRKPDKRARKNMESVLKYENDYLNHYELLNKHNIDTVKVTKDERY
jgi:hypothetical protein